MKVSVHSVADYTDSEHGPVCQIVACLQGAFAFFDGHWHCVDHTVEVIEMIEAQWLDPSVTGRLAASGMWEHLAYRR